MSRVSKFIKPNVWLILLLIFFLVNVGISVPDPDLHLDDFPASQSYVIKTDGSECWAIADTGEIAYSSTNASYVLDSCVEEGATVLVRKGLYTISYNLSLDCSNFRLMGESPFGRTNTSAVMEYMEGTVFLMDSGGGIALSPDPNDKQGKAGNPAQLSNVFIENIHFLDKGKFDGSSPTAGQCIWSDTSLYSSEQSRLWRIHIEHCRFSGFLKDLGGGSYAKTIDLKSPEWCVIRDNSFSETKSTHISLEPYGAYLAGNNRILNNFIGVYDHIDGSCGVYIKNCTNNHSINNQYFGDGGVLTYVFSAIHIVASTGKSANIKSMFDRFENLQAVTSDGGAGEVQVQVYFAEMWNTMPSGCFFTFDDNTFDSVIEGCYIAGSGAPQRILEDEQDFLPKANAFIDNDLSIFDIGQSPSIWNITGQTTIIYGNRGWNSGSSNPIANPLGACSTPFADLGSREIISFFGDSANPINDTGHWVNTCDVVVTSTGGTGVNITITDGDGDVIVTGLTTLTREYVPRMFKVYFVYATTPTVSVWFT